MAEVVLGRELYIDVVVKEAQVEEIFLFRVDFLADKTCTNEYFYKKQEGDPYAEEPLAQFKRQWEQLCIEKVPTKCFATNAQLVMGHVITALTKQDADSVILPVQTVGEEPLHDCISMGRVISMSVFDEISYLSAGIRRRMKERYHEYVDEIKAEHSTHLFLSETESVLELTITKEQYSLKKKKVLSKALPEETLASKLRELLSRYPEAELFVDRVSVKLYQMFHNMNRYMGTQQPWLLFSLESMLYALGKQFSWDDPVQTYLLYLKNQEDIRYGRFVGEQCYSVHSFYLPVQIFGEAAWKKQFKKHPYWKPEGREKYQLSMEGERKGKYSIKSGAEQFTLKLRKVTLQRYLRKYAVLRLEVENYCYPGERDKEKINSYASGLKPGMTADSVQLRIKEGSQGTVFSFSMEGSSENLWLNDLLDLGKKRKKKGVSLLPLNGAMHCVEAANAIDEEVIIQTALIKDGVFRRMEDALAKAVKPEHSDRPTDRLTGRQKNEIRELFILYRYLIVSFGESCEAAQGKAQAALWQETKEKLGTDKVEERLQKKFGLFF